MSFGDSFFGGGKPVPIFYSRPVNKDINWLAGNFKGDDAAYQNALDAFNTANANTTAQLAKNATQANADYNNLYQANQNYNPLDTYATLRSGNLNALKDFSGQLEDAGARNDKLALAAMGMGGQPDSSYASILRADRVSKNMAPVLGNIMSSLGSDTSMIGDQRNQNLSNLTNLINLRTNTPLIGYGMQMDPANALQAIRGNQIGQLGGLGDASRNNTSGYYTKPGAVDYWDRGMQSISRTASVAGQVMGLMGGMGGGGMGGGGGGNAAQSFQGFQLGGMSPNAGGGSGPSMQSMGGGGGGGMDMNTIMSLIKMFQGNQAPAQPMSQSYNPWSNYGGGQDYYDTPSYNTSSPYA